ncbi:MAG TPA: flagellar basal body P-ring protein FlgI, partial [Polyangia bacterium]|nr:flagellar basal body P-ring protein FlgI [Polyangia bacterium]
MRKTIALALLLVTTGASAAPVRVKELVDVQGVRENALFGYGLVVGLSGTGDSERVFFTSQSISGMLGRLGIRIDPKEVRVRNVAAVMVTARLPSFSRPGTRIDVNVSSMGNARSLAGGVLLISPLTGPDGVVYAVAQGPVQAGGFEASGAGSRIQKNQPTSGSVPGGASIERA